MQDVIQRPGGRVICAEPPAIRAGVVGPGPNHRALIPATLDCWAAMDGRHRVLLDRQGQLTACGPGTRQFFDKSRDFQIHGGRLQPVDYRYFAKFRRLYSGAFADVRSEIFPMKSGDGHWICRALPVNAVEPEPLIGLTIQPASVEHGPEWADLREALHLTTTEHKVLHEFLHGLTPHSIAANHKLSINTVRTHFRHIYDKLGVGNSQELRRKLLAYRVR